MNYNDQILENKVFKFSKQLVYNIALSICIVLIGLVVLVYGFHYGLYEVLSNSEYPIFKEGDMVIVKAQSEYKVGDIIKFDTTERKTLPTSHRLLGVIIENNVTYYICHGDAVASANPAVNPEKASWQEDAEYIKSLIDSGKTLAQIKEASKEIQTPNASQVEGKVVGYIANYGTYFKFVKSHYLLLIALVSGVWCIYTCIQNEIEMKKARRLM